ncbi:MAG: RNA 2',3'-cyclic phosphodiesterase [archaeon]|nr:RNA 2',3'-cyclic phosphodiesterase [archaeon]
MRTFIAIELPEDIKSEIFHSFEKLEESGLVGKFVEKNNIHLTLRFIGEVSEEKIEEIKKKLSEIKFKKFKAKIGNIGFFPDENYIRVIWIELVAKEIIELQEIIEEKCREIGIPRDNKGFASHITIARVEKIKNKSLFTEKLKTLHVKKSDFIVKDFSLIKSELKRSGSIYKNLMKFPLD